MGRRAKTSEVSLAATSKHARRRTIQSSPESVALPVKVKRKTHNPNRGDIITRFKPGQPGGPGGLPGKRLLTRVRELLSVTKMNPDGTVKLNEDGTPQTDFDRAAKAYIKAMCKGSFVHLKEFIDREEGRVPHVISGLEENQIKVYVGLPVEGEEAP